MIKGSSVRYERSDPNQPYLKCNMFRYEHDASYDLGSTGAFDISFEFNLKEANPTGSTMLFFSKGDSSVDNSIIMLEHGNTLGTMKLTVAKGDGTTLLNNVSPSNTFSTNVWNTVIVRRDVSDDWHIILNAVDTNVGNASGLFDNTSPIILGAYVIKNYDEAEGGFGGNIKNFVWNGIALPTNINKTQTGIKYASFACRFD